MATGTLPASNAWFQQAPAGPFPGGTVAGFTPLQQQSWGAGLNAANALAGAGAQGYGQYAADRNMGKLGNPMLSAQVGNMWDDAYRGFQRNTMPAINDEMTRAGQGYGNNARYGQTRAGIAQGNAMSDLNRQLTDAGTNMYSNAWGQGLNYTANMANAFPNQMNALKLGLLAPSQMAGQIGQQQQNMNQARLTEAGNMWNQVQNAPYDRLSQYSNLVNQTQGFGGGSQTVPVGTQAGNILGGAMAGGSLANSLYNAWAPASTPTPATNYNAPTGGFNNPLPINTPWGGR